MQSKEVRKAKEVLLYIVRQWREKNGWSTEKEKQERGSPVAPSPP
eukprot:SAG11_NODE_7138_length_1188_cov_1.292929_1_plen_44_part_10